MNQPASSPRCRGLTLVELLAVIAIIGLLVGLLMPALQSARESSRRTTCTGNLKTIATACLSHLEHIGTFPSAGWPVYGSPDAQLGFNEEQPGGWLFNVLPFMELEALRNRNGSAAAICPPAFACPTTVAGGAVASTPTGNVKRGIGCYAGNMGGGSMDGRARLPRFQAYVSGSCIDSRNLTSLDKAEREAAYPTFVGYGHRIAGVNDANGYSTRHPCPQDNGAGFINGIICTFGRIRAAHVTDGLQNTVMFAERPVLVNNFVLGNGTPCDTAAPWTGWGAWAYWKTTAAAPWIFIQGSPQNGGCGNGSSPGSFGSRHGTTFGAAFCDGSVRHVGFDVDAVTVWSPLGSRNGREVVAPPW
jgi:prepilin-type N-terminal cleavage/methylation domain-containing protein